MQWGAAELLIAEHSWIPLPHIECMLLMARRVLLWILCQVSHCWPEPEGSGAHRHMWGQRGLETPTPALQKQGEV